MLQRHRARLQRFAQGGAWFFIVVSLLHLAWAIGVKWSDPAGPTRLYQTSVGGITYDAWALTYTGRLGLLLALAQAVLVTGATVVSVRRLGFPLRLRRIGHGVLCGWAALWFLNMMRLAGLDHALDSLAQTSLLGLLLACTALRAAPSWTQRGSSPPP